MASSQQQQRERATSGGGGGNQWGSPERTMVWREPNNGKARRKKAVGVVYYLCRRDGQLEHPHFMEVSSSSSSSDQHVIRLRDFTARLDTVRGKGMSSLYSWSSKRSYKHNGCFVWHDLTDDDVIHPAPNNEYILKGSQLLHLPVSPPLPLPQHQQQRNEDTTTTTRPAGRRRNWSSFDLAEYRPQQRMTPPSFSYSTELAIDEISPPPSSSSPDVDTNQQSVGVIAGGRMRASSVLMRLISCGITRCRASGSPSSSSAAAAAGGGDIITQDRDYYSGSLLIESSNKNAQPPLLNRSSSCNVDRRRPVESNSKHCIIVPSRTDP